MKRESFIIDLLSNRKGNNLLLIFKVIEKGTNLPRIISDAAMVITAHNTDLDLNDGIICAPILEYS